MRSLTIFFLIISCICCKTVKDSKNLTQLDHPAFKKIFPFALRGDLHAVFDILDTLHEKNLSEQQSELKRKYQNRFINGTEVYDYKTQDSSIIDFVLLFHEYWKSSMLEDLTIDQADSAFVKRMANYLYKQEYYSNQVPIDSLQQNIYVYANEFLNKKGYFSNAFGKTGHLYDLFLWTSEEVVAYPISLVDDSIYVTVHLMDDFISTGWSHYTTFGRSYASGWSTREALYCVVSAYDIESEHFEVSYLTHEGQHFFDFTKYPKLKQKDLEYRAKLVELIKSNHTTLQIIGKFVNNASFPSENAHAMANYCVIRDLSTILFQRDYVSKKSDWLTVESDLIKEKSRHLFYSHSEKLDSIGAKIVTELIK